MHSNESTLEDIFLELAYGNDERNASFELPELSAEEEEIEEKAAPAKKKAEKEEEVTSSPYPRLKHS
jgi:hypothetical protein